MNLLRPKGFLQEPPGPVGNRLISSYIPFFFCSRYHTTHRQLHQQCCSDGPAGHQQHPGVLHRTYRLWYLRTDQPGDSHISSRGQLPSGYHECHLHLHRCLGQRRPALYLQCGCQCRFVFLLLIVLEALGSSGEVAGLWIALFVVVILLRPCLERY